MFITDITQNDVVDVGRGGGSGGGGCRESVAARSLTPAVAADAGTIVTSSAFQNILLIIF